LTVALPVLNEAADIGDVLDALLSQSPVPGGFEVVVADGGSTDATREIVRQRQGGEVSLRLFDNPRRLSSAGRNVGATAARGEFILFLDGHCEVPREDYLRRVVEIFEETGADCLSRPQYLDRMVDGSWAEAIAEARHSWFGHNPGSDIYGDQARRTDPRSAGAAYRRGLWVSLGGYDERFDACEDVEFNHRVDESGAVAYTHPDLAIHYRPRNSVRALYRQMARYGRGRARMMAKHPSMVPLPLVALSLAVLFAVVAGLVRGWSAFALVGGGMLALWTILGFVEALRSSAAGRVLRVVACFGAIHSGLLLGFWRGLVEGARYRGAGPAPSAGSEL
jgi:succinoglycan biosynthesis protein ExoA